MVAPKTWNQRSVGPQGLRNFILGSGQGSTSSFSSPPQPNVASYYPCHKVAGRSGPLGRDSRNSRRPKTIAIAINDDSRVLADQHDQEAVQYIVRHDLDVS